MDSGFRSTLSKHKIKSNVISLLENEDITDFEIFRSLRESDLRLLMDKASLSVGQFSLLCGLWRSGAVVRGNGNREGSVSEDTSETDSASSHSSIEPIDRRELFLKYKARMNELRSVGQAIGKKPAQPSSNPHSKKQLVALHLGGMIFEQQRQRGVKKKTLPPPKVVDFQKNSRYADIISKGREIFFKEETDDISNYCLCGPSGIPFEVDSKDWVLDSFLKLHNFQPSRLRLYVMHTVETGEARKSATDGEEDLLTTSGEVFSSEDELHSPMQSPSSPSRSCIKHSKPVEKECVQCHHPFLAPVEDTICDLPDGTSVSYCDPVLKCPLCDEQQFGAYMNKDFLPELAKW